MNSSNQQPDDELRALLSGLFDEDLGEEEFAELSRRLRDDPEARSAYFEAAALEVNLEHLYARPLGRSQVSPDRRRAANRRLAKQSLGVAALVALLIALTMAIFRSPTEPAPAALRFCGNSEWAVDGQAGLASAGLTPGSTLVIEQGVAELALPDEVRALVEAPATVHLIDMRTLELTRGRAYFEVRSAEGRGFTVVTPHQRIVDLGTAFGVSAGSGKTELEVMEGRVRVDAVDGTPGETLAAPTHVRLEGARVESEIPEGSTDFLQELPPGVETLFEDDFETGLAPGKEYAVILGRDLVRDLHGNRFAGMEDPEAWTFTTGDAFPVSLPARNPGFEEDGEERSGGASIAAWHSGGLSWGRGVDESRSGLMPTEGRFFGWVCMNHVITQHLKVPIVAGTTYVLKVDVGLAGTGARIFFFGSDEGRSVPLAQKTFHSDDTVWLKDRVVFFTAQDEHATGQTLRIGLDEESGDSDRGKENIAAFDRVRVGTSGPTAGGARPEDFQLALTELESDDRAAGPVIERLHPGRGVDAAVPGDLLAIRFDEPICFGFGRILIRNVTDWRETELIAASPEMSIEDRVLTIRPPIGIRDGERHLGRICGWEGDAWAGVFNPAGDGTWYRNPELADEESEEGGVIGVMRGPVMATFADAAPGTFVGREIGRIESGRRYSMKVALGIRDLGSTDPAVFDGYTVRLISGDTVLAEMAEDVPPGPPNEVTTVGFSWDSDELPEGVGPGDPLRLKISPNQASGGDHGYLDVARVSVTATATASKKN